MNKYDMAVEFINKSSDIVTSKELKNHKVTYFMISKLMEDGFLERISRGVYIKTGVMEDEYFIYQQKYKSIIYSYNTALFFLNKTEITPDKMDVTVTKGYNVHRFPKKFRVHYTTKENKNLGVIEVRSYYGNIIKVYNLERTICDIVKSNNSGLDVEQMNKIIRNSFYSHDIDYFKLIKYSKILRCYEKIKNIMEILA